MSALPPTVAWAPDGDAVRIVDQRRLPGALVFADLRTMDDVVDAIRTLAVRGAPAIGVAGAMGLAVAVGAASDAEFVEAFDAAARAIGEARPTAVNLPWAIARMRAVAAPLLGDPPRARAALRAEAEAIRAEDVALCDAIAQHGLTLLADGMTILTHCNAGALATAGMGTALAPVHLAAARGWRIRVLADETRPLLQGARLTAWELAQAGVDVTVITDGMAAAALREHAVGAVLVGADRICANGDVVNKVGTYGVALAARAHGVPFYVLAPTSTVDPATPHGPAVTIEARDAREVTHPLGQPAVAAGVRAWNPAFDWTPAALVTAIVTDRGVHHPPYDFSRAHSS